MTTDFRPGTYSVRLQRSCRQFLARAAFASALACFVSMPADSSARVIVNEVLASNAGGLRDADGDSPDWIELANLGSNPVSLADWFLTDDPAEPRKWRFPAVEIPPSGFLIVFASGKDRARADAELHTNFALDVGGGYIALVEPDGVTVADGRSLVVPPLRENLSYGFAREIAGSALVDAASRARIHVPESAVLGDRWTGSPGDEPFDDSTDAGWIDGELGVGFDVGSDPRRPLLYLPFDDASDPSRAPDASGEANHGVVTSHRALAGQGAATVPKYTPDAGGHTGLAGDRAIDFGLRGEGGLIHVPSAVQGAFDSATRNDAITISLWIFGSSDQPANDSIFWGSSSPDGTGIRSLNAHVPWSDAVVYWDTAGCCDGTQRISRAESDPDLWRAGWNHYVFLKNGDRKEIWQNGVLFASGVNTADLTLVRGFFIGGALNNGEFSYGGKIDDFAVWDRALGEAEIHGLAAGASPLALSSISHLVRTDLREALFGLRTSAYLRIPFSWPADPGPDADASIDVLLLRMKYNDAVVAYLDGSEIARRNAPDPVAFDSIALAERSYEQSSVSEEFLMDLSSEAPRGGTGILAIRGLNHAVDSTDFLILPELSIQRLAPNRFLASPTPGAPNAAGYAGFVADTAFSVDRGLFDAPFSVEITTATPGAQIHYSTDGSAPRPGAPGSRLYVEPISITTTTVLRAAAFKDGLQPTNVDTQTYIFPTAVARQPARPAGLPPEWSGGTRADYEVDPDVVSTTIPGYSFEDALESIPTVSLALDPADLFGRESGIYYHSGGRSERAGSIELFGGEDSESFGAGAGIRIHGYTSRDHGFTPKHSFRVVFKSEFGPRKLERDVFADSPVARFDQLVLRGMSTDSWPVMDGWASPIPGVPRWFRHKSQYLREQWMRDSQRAMGQLSCHGRYVNLYLNGLYWGLYLLTERATDSFFAEHTGGEREEWDVLKDFAELHSGESRAWNEMMALASAGFRSVAAFERLRGNDASGVRDPALPRYLDIDHHIDYMILHIFSGADDWPNHNWWTGRRRGDESDGFRFIAWDQEISNISLVQTQTSWGPRFEDVSAPNSPAVLYSRLRENVEWRQLFADRVQRHLFGGGALTPESCDERWMVRAAEIDRAIVGESARWGDARRSVPFRREVEWLAEQNWLRTTYWKENHRIALDRFRRVGLYPTVVAPAFDRHGGRIEPGQEITMSAPEGVIYYAPDGEDPRLPGGGVSAAALVYERPIRLDSTTILKARVYHQRKWSALVEALFFVDVPLRVTEIHYHPGTSPFPDDDGADPDAFEFIEVQNVGSVPLDLAGVRLEGAVRFDFAAGRSSTLAPGELAVVVRDAAAFATRADDSALRALIGSYAGGLDNSGERVRLVGAAGEPILDFAYADSWYPETDGGGRSLVIGDPRMDPALWGDAAGWRPSAAVGGSPGRDESEIPRGLRRPGDFDADGRVTISDAIAILGALFGGASSPLPCESELEAIGNRGILDANGDENVDLSDAVALLSFLFLGGPQHVLGMECVPLQGCDEGCAGR
jgi:hypothetical protein